MTLEDASQRYGITMEKLKFYVRRGLLDEVPAEDGDPGYREEDFKKIGQIHMLVEGGMKQEDLKMFLDLPEGCEEGRTKKAIILKKCRLNLLEEIHRKQQILDRIDYCIYELKK